MVTKQNGQTRKSNASSVLAKIHMVTKRTKGVINMKYGSVLAKIHMVTKRTPLPSTRKRVLF